MRLSADRQNRIRVSIDFILSRLLIIFFFCILIVYASREIVDLDLWLHLKSGQTILQQHIIPSSDIFSFTLHGKPWINHEGLFQVLAYLCYAGAGPDGLILMQNIVLIVTFLLLFFSARKENNTVFVFAVLYLTLHACAYRFTLRPDIFSLFFMTTYLCLIKSYVEKKSTLIWALPLLQVLWTNMHGFSFIGPLIILVFLCAELLKRSVRLPASWNLIRRLDERQMKQLLVVFGLVIAASLLNPYGLKGAAYPFSVLGQISGKGRIIFQYIQELAKPIALNNILDFKYFLFYKVLILTSLFSFRFNARHINVADLLLWIFFMGFSLLAIRNVAAFALMAAFVTFNNIDLAFENNKVLPALFTKRKFRILLGYGCVAVLFIYPARDALKYLESATYNFDTYELKSSMWGLSENRYPQKAADFLLTHNFPQRIINDFNSGSYLIGRAYPKRQVFIDGRTELYGPDFFADYVRLGEGEGAIAQKWIKKYALEGFFLTIATDDLHTGLMRSLLHDPEWKVVYLDEYAVILLKDTPENAKLIKQFRIDLARWIPPEPDFLKIGIVMRYPLPYINRARFLNRYGFFEAAAKEARIILDLVPHNAEALRFMADHYFEKKDYKKAFICARNCLIYAPGDLTMRMKLALIYANLKEDKKALKLIDAVIKKRPKAAQAYYTKALLVKETDVPQTRKLLEQAIKLSPKEPRFHEELGDLLARQGEIDAARREWTDALAYDPSNASLKKKLKE